ncbi:phosphonate C-P lyase system protein PhnL [Vagococcus penaei]|uniref:Phosphonate C-P lyase system protein PhnL n=1 Tax=Vagococcus penaei TaxID=633807 RepID=A0A1Q2D746_9ENTE|nr:ATP-binding cassette domain-containing protein [Vagococcus penaei]AQP54204.1 phosphonate C-P lyase system protein PhnL [Vagococcus penaei]RST99988.1 phosphonate C-P lyase system protein PhnL [Vagococcus penaei]
MKQRIESNLADNHLIQVTDLAKQFTLHHVDKQVIGCQEINLALPKGGFIGITGKSGSGKSTILRCIYRTNLPQKGSILYDSTLYGVVDLADLSERQVAQIRRSEIGYVSQFLQSLPRTTAYDIVYRSALESYDKEEAQVKTEEMLRHFEIKEDLWTLFPNTFSGGEKLRLNIAKAMVKKPKLLLLDEPTASLDQHSKEKVRDVIIQLKAAGTSMIGIFHDLEFMDGLCDQEFNIQKGRFIS